MIEETKKVRLNSLSNFLHYFERDLDIVGVSNFSHDQAFANGVKISQKQMNRITALWLNRKYDELKQFLKELKMID